MKISELIKFLENVKDRFGDAQIFTRFTVYSDGTECVKDFSVKNCSVKSYVDEKGVVENPKLYLVDVDWEDVV